MGAHGVVRYALYALLIFTPLARGAVQGWAVTIVHILSLAALTALLLNKSLSWDWKWIKTPLDKPILCLLVLCFLASVFSIHHRTSLWAVVLLLNYLTIYYVVIHTVRSRSQFQRLIYLIIGIAAFLSIFGLFRKFGVNPFPWWEYSDLGYNPDWVSATYGSHNHLAGYLEMAIPLILGFFLTGYKGETFEKRNIFIMIYLTLIMLTALVFSLSRGGWIGFLLGLTFMAFALLTNRHFKSKRSLAALIGGILALVLIVLASTPVVERIRTLPEKEAEVSLHGRVVVWGEVMEMIGDHPLLGTGPGTFATVFTQYQPPGLRCRFTMAHNDYLHFISETGLMLIPIIIWMVIALYRKGFEKMAVLQRSRGMTLGAMSGITAILVHSVVDFNLHIPANAILFTVLAAIVAAPLPKQDHKNFQL